MNPVVNTKDISQELDRLLDELSAFETILDEEAKHLQKVDPDSLLSLLKNKEALSERVSKQFLALSKILSPSTKDPLSLKELLLIESIQSLPPTVIDKLETANAQATSCYKKNTANGIAVHAMSNMNQSVLNLLKGQPENNQTYSASGKASLGKPNATPLGKA